jgi:SAM-dependent methyltransferase
MLTNGPQLLPTLKDWWEEARARDGFFGAARQLAGHFWDFTRDSFPDRRRQRYGDIDYDFDFHVNTTGATVAWRDRLLGHFLSPYQPTEPALFHEMLAALSIDFSQFTFIDLGSGKGRTLLMAADYPFRRVLGVEILPELNHTAQENIRHYQSATQKCFVIESICEDARAFVFPPEPTVLYLFNPLPEAALVHVLGKLEGSLLTQPRACTVLYHNPLLEPVFAQSDTLKKRLGTHQYSIYDNGL